MFFVGVHRHVFMNTELLRRQTQRSLASSEQRYTKAFSSAATEAYGEKCEKIKTETVSGADGQTVRH